MTLKLTADKKWNEEFGIESVEIILLSTTERRKEERTYKLLSSG